MCFFLSMVHFVFNVFRILVQYTFTHILKLTCVQALVDVI